MAYINIPDDLLSPSELEDFKKGLDEAVKEKNITGSVWAIVGPVKRLGFVK